MRVLPIELGAITCGGLAGALFGVGQAVAGTVLIVAGAGALLWSMVALRRASKVVPVDRERAPTAR